MVIVVSNVHASIYIFISICYDASLSMREGNEIKRFPKEINKCMRDRETLNLYTSHDVINTYNFHSNTSLSLDYIMYSCDE